MSAICRGMAAVLISAVLVACEEEQAPQDFATSTTSTAIMADRRTACEDSGGRWGPTAIGALFICFRTLPDANTQCRTGADCEGFCFARSRTCSPFEPLYGCHEVLSSGGLPQTVCVE